MLCYLGLLLKQKFNECIVSKVLPNIWTHHSGCKLYMKMDSGWMGRPESTLGCTGMGGLTWFHQVSGPGRQYTSSHPQWAWGLQRPSPRTELHQRCTWMERWCVNTVDSTLRTLSLLLPMPLLSALLFRVTLPSYWWKWKVRQEKFLRYGLSFSGFYFWRNFSAWVFTVGQDVYILLSSGNPCAMVWMLDVPKVYLLSVWFPRWWYWEVVKLSGGP